MVAKTAPTAHTPSQAAFGDALASYELERGNACLRYFFLALSRVRPTSFFYLNNPKSVASILSVMRLKASVSDSNFCVSPSTMISLPL